ncbi:hypothetical protein Tco_0938887 [Tanacetum coccineum]|uniref:Reverse transcriptase domain-containing protein n=1 Tax=Tanacetum coccineum TaxID=301880 RepID=A0ABQ5DJB8_9ASTR
MTATRQLQTPLDSDPDQFDEEDSIDYPDEHEEDNDEDPKEDPSEEHEPEDDDEDPEEDPSEEHEPGDEDIKEEEPFEGSVETEPFEEDETAVTPPPLGHRGARISVRPQTPMAASTQALIDAFAMTSSRRTCHLRGELYYSGSHLVAMCIEFVAALNHLESVYFVNMLRAGQASEHRMMASIEEVNLKISYQAQIDVVRCQMTAYETIYDDMRTSQAYLSFEDQNMALLARLETLETHMSRMDCRIIPTTRQGTNAVMILVSIQAMIVQGIQRNSTHTQDDGSQSTGGGIRRPVQPARVCSYTDFMKCQPLNFKGTEGVVGLSQWFKKMESIFHISGCTIDNQIFKVRGNDVTAYTQHFQELALMCTKFLADETKKINKYICGLPDNIHGNVMSVRPKTLDDAIELANDLMDQKLRTYAERQNDNKRNADDSSRNNQQQQPH